MQDIVFYAAANETLGVIRDYANERNSPAPVLTLGVSVCLRMRLFSSTEGATPYPIASLNGISDWQWCMDSDFDRDTACKLVADAGGISVHTETDTVNGETMSFTEFVIPISNMNTEELAAWLGNEKMKPGLTGELVGYDSYGNAAFVLQIENFSVRNRVAGLGDPTVLDQETVTRTQAELMIQTAVSTSAATKQDKLTSANAGTGISITSSGIISTANVPQSAVSGLSETLAAKQNNITAGYRMVLVNGSTVDQARYFTIEPAITAPANNTTTVVLSAGKAYEIHAVANQAKVLLNRENPPSARTFGLEGHAEIFVANTGYIQTGANVVLANALEPDAVNNCTVRFHDGLAIISVEDHVAGYIVVSATGSTAGTLPYALGSASQEYVAFDATLNGQTLDMGGAVTNGEKHIVGNGYSETIVSGGINCTSKTTFANLGMNGVVVSSGTLTLGDVYIPSGSTVAVSGGGLAVEKVTGNGGVIDLGGTIATVPSGSTASASGCTFSGGYASATNGGVALLSRNVSFFASHCGFDRNSSYNAGGAFALVSGNTLTLSGCTITNNYAYNCGGIFLFSGGVCELTSCTMSGNSGFNGTCLNVNVGGSAYLNGCTLTGNHASNTGGGISTAGTVNVTSCIVSGNTPEDVLITSNNVTLNDCTVGVCTTSGGTVTFAGINSLTSAGGGTGTVIISSGATLDLTGNTNTTPIAPGGGITFASGGATVKVGDSTASSSYMMDNVTLPAGAKLTNTNVVNLGGSNVIVSSGTTASASGCTFSGGSASSGGGAFVVSGASASATLTSCGISGCSASYGGAIALLGGASVLLSSCTIGNNTFSAGTLYVNAAELVLSDCIVEKDQNTRLQGTSGHLVFAGSNTYKGDFQYLGGGFVTISSGAIVDLTGNTNATPIYPGGGITLYGGALNSATTIIYSSGGNVGSRTFEDLEIQGATITKLGLVYGATVYSLAGDDHEIIYTEDNGATSSSVFISGETVYVVPGALMKVANT